MQEKFELYKNAIARTRWLMFLITFVSCLIFCHIFLERFSFDGEQLRGVYKYRMKNGNPALKIKQDSTWLTDSISWANSINLSERDSFNKRLTIYSSRKYSFKKTNNTLNKMSFGMIEIPLAGISVNSNDYIIVVASMLFVLIVAFWLTIQSILVIVTKLDLENGEIKELVNLNFTFIGFTDTKGANLAKIIQTITFLIPTIVLVVAIIIDSFPLWGEIVKGYSGPSWSLILRYIILFGITIGTAVLSMNTLKKANKIDNLIEKEGESGA